MAAMPLVQFGFEVLVFPDQVRFFSFYFTVQDQELADERGQYGQKPDVLLKRNILTEKPVDSQYAFGGLVHDDRYA